VDMIDVIPFAAAMTTVINILYVVLGLGLVIFFHELGHFAVAKWCDVHVERFSIGFGPILFSWKWGETEYALSAIPFGGYVKMLGQDDMDPSQLTSEEIAQDPRAYSAKSVPQRMAIISAGVIMNVITAMLFYALAFGIGVQTPPPEVGATRVGMPAWKAGMQTGDRITSINGRTIESFMDITRMVALSSEELTIEGRRPDGTTFKRVITPDGSGTRRRIGVQPVRSTALITPRKNDDRLVTVPGTPAHNAEPPFKPGDVIQRIDDVSIPDFATLQRVLANRRDKTVRFRVKRRDGGEATIPVQRNPFRTLGLSMDIGEITAVRRGSPAERAELQTGDVIAKVNGKAIGKELNPLRLPDLFEQACREGKTVEMHILRHRKEGGSDELSISVEFQPDDPVIPAWTEQPSAPDVPLSVPSLGIAFHMIPTVMRVDEGSPAADAGIQPQDRLKTMVFTLPEDAEKDGINDNKPVTVEFGTQDDSGRPIHNWAHAFWMMQGLPNRTITLTIAPGDKQQNVREVTLLPQKAEDWSLPIRGIRPAVKLITLQASGPLSALQLGLKRGRDMLVDVYLTIASLFGGRLSYKELSGPVRIAKVAYQVAEQGFTDFLIFLGFLSINLAVLNFLPIPILDGGHMVFLIWEAVTRKKPSEKVMIGATYVGLAIVLGLMGLVLYLDIFVHG